MFSQNIPLTRNNILKYLETNFTNWTSGNEKINNFIQERQLKNNNYNDIVLEWIPYNQFNEIKETGKNGLITVYSAIWKDGPLYKKYVMSNYTRDSNKQVALKCLHNSQESIDSLINETKKYPTKREALQALYGISQNPDTGDYILVQNYTANWISGNEKIDDFIQERQLKISYYDDIVLEWIPYNQLNEIKETGKNGLITVYSAIWKDGPLQYYYNRYTRDSNKQVALKCLHNSQESIDSLINEAKKYPTKRAALQALYGISQNPDTGDFILVQSYIIINLANWISGNEKINDFIQERQLKISYYDDIVLEWIPYNQLNEIKETGKNGLITVYSAIWKDGPLQYYYNRYTRDSNKQVALKCLHNSQKSIDSLINKAKKYPTKCKAFQALYGISQNPNTGDYILVLIWASGNEKIDDFIQERQLKNNGFDDVVLEWIPYNRFNEIKEIGTKNSLITVYPAKWKDGPLYKEDVLSDYTRDSNKEVALKCLHNSQESIDSLINETKKYPTKYKVLQALYGISQNPDTGDYILIQNYTANWISGNEKIDNFIQERQLKISYYNDIVLEWIPYNQLNEIKETGKNGLITVYSAIWKDGPLYKKYVMSNYTRDSNNKVVALKCLHNSQESIDSLINEVKKYPLKRKAFQVLYGISQNPNTGDYILIQNYTINLANWISGNEKIDDFIQEKQLKINYNDDTVFEWIPYNQFNEIKETSKTDLITVYSAIWKDGLLQYCYNKYTRDSNKQVTLKYLHNSQESIDFLINEAKKYPLKHKAFQVLYGISQNPNTGDYILVQNYTINLANWISGNEKIDDFIQERQLNYDDTVFEWIPYNQFNEIKETSKTDLITVYSAIWKDGLLYKKNETSKYTRDSNKQVALKYLHNLQESIDFLINEVKKYPTKNEAFQILYGISQNPDTGDYILVQSYAINLANWISGNEKIDDFIQERQLKISYYDDIVLEWISYNQLNEIKETGKNDLITVYSAIWKDGPLYYNEQYEEYTRDSNKKVGLKCLHNSQESIDSLINEAKKYSKKHKASQVLYGISQNPDTGDYILIQSYTINMANWISENEKIDDLTQERQLSEPSIAMGVDQEDYSFIISDKVQEELQKIINDTNVRDIFFGRDHHKDEVSSNKNQKLYIIVNNIPTEPLQMSENFSVTYIEWGTFSEKIPRNIPPQKSFPSDIKEKFDSILDDQIGISFRSKYCNLIAISLGWKIVGRDYTEKPAIVFYVIRKGIIPIGDDLLPETINGIDTDVREGFYEPTGLVDSQSCRKYSASVSSGCSIGICDFRAGTLGAFVKNSNGQICLLSNHHVLCSNDNRKIEYIVKQPAYIDHVGAIKEEIEEEKKNLARAKYVDKNMEEANDKSDEIETLEVKLKVAKRKDTKFARYIEGKRDNCTVDRSSYGVDAAIASLELIDNDRKRYIRPKDFAIPNSAFEKCSLTVPFQLSGIIKNINSFDTSKSIFKVGRTTGLTKGRIPDLIGISFNSMEGLSVYKHQLSILGGVQMEEVNDSESKTIFQPIWLDRQIVVLQKGDGSFMEKGDSGCIWFDQNGMIIALGHGVFTRNESVYAVGSPINAVLKALKVELYLGEINEK